MSLALEGRINYSMFGFKLQLFLFHYIYKGYSLNKISQEYLQYIYIYIVHSAILKMKIRITPKFKFSAQNPPEAPVSLLTEAKIIKSLNMGT